MKRFKVCALVLIFLLCQRPVFAELFDIPPGSLEQTLAAYKDATGQNLVYMNSLVTGKSSPGVKGDLSPKQAMDTILDGTGLSFELTAQGDMVLKKTVSSPSPTKKANTSIADPGLMSMEQMVVTATKTPIKTKEVPAAIGVVTSEDMNLRARTDNFRDAIRNVPGVFTSAPNDMGAESLFIRGMLPAIMINGRDVRHFSTVYLLDSALMSMGAVERIEILKGPQSTMYGGKSISGTINIITKKGDKAHPHAEVDVLYGSGQEFAGGTSFGGGKDKLSYFVSAYGATKAEWKTPKGKIPYVEKDQQNLYACFDYELLSGHTISLEYMYNESNRKTGGRGYQYEKMPDFYKTIWDVEPSFHAAYLSYNGNLAEWLSLYATFGTGKNDLDFQYGYNGSNENTPLEDYLSRANYTTMKNDFLYGEIRGTMNLLAEDQLRILVGVQYKSVDLDWIGIREHKPADQMPSISISESETYLAPYAQIEFRPVDYALVVGGIRHDRYSYDKSKSKSSTNPKIAVSFFPFVRTAYNWTTLWGSYSEAFTPPTAIQIQGPQWLGGNPDVKPEKTKGLEIGIKQRFGRWATLEASYFDVDYKDMIVRIPRPDNPSRNYFTNASKASLKGWELLCEAYPFDWLILHFGYTDMKRKNEVTGKKLNGMPNKIFQYGITIHDINNFSISIWGRQNSDYKNHDSHHLVGMEKNYPSEDKIIWDMKILYRFDIKEGIICEPFLSVHNIGNETYYSGMNPCIMEERTYQAGINFKIDF